MDERHGTKRQAAGDARAPERTCDAARIEAEPVALVEVIVERPSTGQVLASGFAEMDIVAPAVFAGAGGRGQVAAINQDGSINSPSNPAPRGSVVTIFVVATAIRYTARMPPTASYLKKALCCDTHNS